MSVALNHIDCEPPNDDEASSDDGHSFAGCTCSRFFLCAFLISTFGRLEMEILVFSFGVLAHHGCPLVRKSTNVRNCTGPRSQNTTNDAPYCKALSSPGRGRLLEPCTLYERLVNVTISINRCVSIILYHLSARSFARVSYDIYS